VRAFSISEVSQRECTSSHYAACVVRASSGSGICGCPIAYEKREAEEDNKELHLDVFVDEVIVRD